MPLPAAIAAEKDLSASFGRWMQTLGLHWGAQGGQAMALSGQQPVQQIEAERRAKRDAAAVQRKRMRSISMLCCHMSSAPSVNLPAPLS